MLDSAHDSDDELSGLHWTWPRCGDEHVVTCVYGSMTPSWMVLGRGLRQQFSAPPGFVETFIATWLTRTSDSRKQGTRGEPFDSDKKRCSEFANVVTEIGRAASRMRTKVGNPVLVMASTVQTT